MKTATTAEVLARLRGFEERHANRVLDGVLVPAEIDHAPYAKYHNADEPGECPLCETLLKVRAKRQQLEEAGREQPPEMVRRKVGTKRPPRKKRDV